MNARGLNRRGVLFTIMILFLALALLGINSMLSSTLREASSMNEALSFSVVGGKYNNLERALIDLDRLSYNKTMLERMLPFTFELSSEKKSFSSAQDLPLIEAKLQAFFDLMNTSEVFFEDNNRENVFDGTLVDLNVPKSAAWGGTNEKASFLMSPFCYEYLIADKNNFFFKPSSSPKCETSFVFSALKRIDINITINNGADDYNRLTCNGGVCPQDSYTHSSSPYYKITIFDENCASCALTQKTASAYFDYSADLNILLYCSGASCTTQPLRINQKNFDFNFYHAGNSRVNISTSITFDAEPEGFSVLDINLGVQDSSGENRK